MPIHLYNFADNRAILDNYFAHNRDMYNVPVAIANGDIPYTYNVCVTYPKPFNFWGKSRAVYTVGLGNNKTYLEYARAFGAEITKHPYNNNWKLSQFANEYDAYTLTKFMALIYLTHKP